MYRTVIVNTESIGETLAKHITYTVVFYHMLHVKLNNYVNQTVSTFLAAVDHTPDGRDPSVPKEAAVPVLGFV